MVMTPAAGVDEERAAHRFAGAFLMPADVVRAEIGAQRSAISIGEFVAIKERFGVSVQAIAYRCLDLGIIEKKAFSLLFKEFTKRGWRKEPFAEPACISPEYEEPKRFERLCYRALAEGVIGESRAAEMLGITLQKLDQRLAEAV
ncbi:ImmA/IrrE family metallo-endopeptidase [Tsuneonella sp. CC-YZS046]|uniref:ImmA/IrrE family metallo-endopeptidase n=1 Tax=Tsuneonella sp. CC-YZS046 TaxID=3042152 RepID=UPI002D794437|nr:ImmA/IrrE family metallo-endopeptidase [Tsuneonella sp. CC-YZS046]WRO66648.1 ImmA/IrrE family metallo-endopeptidase [Tsuneonella sp. CC-YZS046]